MSIDREAAGERLYKLLREAELRDRAALDKAGWAGTAMPLIPEQTLRAHVANIVIVVLGEDEEDTCEHNWVTAYGGPDGNEVLSYLHCGYCGKKKFS